MTGSVENDSYDVYICYAQEDMCIAEQVCITMKKAGITCFLDRQEIIKGMKASQTLVTAIKNSKVFLFIASSRSNCHPFASREIFFAHDTLHSEKMISYTIDDSWLPEKIDLFFPINSQYRLKTDQTDILVKKVLLMLGREVPTDTFTDYKIPVSKFYNNCMEIVVKGVKFKMIRVEGGAFSMGGTSEQGKDAEFLTELPTRQVALSSFYIGETLVTQALWKAVIGNNPSYYKGDNRPVESVYYNEIVELFIPKLNELTGMYFRLPKEAEWEYAARGGKTGGTKYAGSNEIDNVAWYEKNSNNMTHPVKMKQPNELGLFDMSGNVGEWCQDEHEHNSGYWQLDPLGDAIVGTNHQTVRGGGYNYVPFFCRVCYRHIFHGPDSHVNYVGFRIAL